MAKSRKRLLQPLLERYSSDIGEAFLSSIQSITDTDFARLVDRISAGDIAGAIAVLRIDRDAFAKFSQMLTQSFIAGGDAAVSSMPKRKPDGSKFIVRFDAANPEAEAWLKNHSSNAVREITEDQLVMVRNSLSAGMAEGINPRTMGLDLVGRYDKAAGKRVGGSIGLTAKQETIVRNVSTALKTGDYEKYLTYKLRNKMFDRVVNKAIKDGTSIPAATIAKMVGRYKDNLLRKRGETIGETEAMATLHRGRYQAFAQAIARGEVTPDEIERSWQTAEDQKVRESHVKMNGQTIRFYDKYTTPSGAKLLTPGDPNGPASEIIGCRCTEEIRINFLGRLRR